MALGEILFLSAHLKVLHADISTLIANELYLLLTPLPHLIVIVLLTWFISSRGISIFNFSKSKNDIPRKFFIQTDRMIVLLVPIVFILLVFQAVCIHAVYNFYPNQILYSIPPEDIGIIMGVASIFIVLIILHLIRQLMELVNQESKFKVQQTYMETVDEMVVAIRAQQHDQIGHLQTLYGYLQLEYINEARLYMEEMIGEVKHTHQFTSIEDVGLSALAYTKMGIASANGINFNISVNTDLKQLPISPYDLNRILGNLIGNSFDHVIDLHDDMKKVDFRVGRDDNCYVFEVSNYGHIDDYLAARIFDKGFTSKTGSHAGLGLYIVQELVNRHGGKITFSNENDMVTFSVYFPVKEDKHESTRPKTSSPAGQEFARNHLRG